MNDRLESYYKQIQSQSEMLELSRKVLSSLLSEEEALKLKEIFRVLCKRLHPDLNPHQSEAAMVPEKVLTMKREPENQYDEFAISIYCDNVRIGYVPAEMNLVCSRLMDAGKLFFCRVVRKKWQNKWLKINANIYMVE